VVLFLVLLKLLTVVVLYLVYASVLKLGSVRVATVEAVVKLVLVTWNLLVTITAAH
jgi:hypothetical protein